MRIHGGYTFIVGVFVMLLSHAVAASAQERGWYVGAGAGASVTDLDEDFWRDDSITSSSFDKSGLGFQVYGGYRLHRYVALEVGYLHFANSVYSGASNGRGSIWVEGPIEGRTEIEGMTMQAVGLWPLFDGRFELYLRGGLFMWDTLANYSATINDIHRFNADGSSLIGGVGADMRVWGNWRIRGGMELTSVNFSNRETALAAMATLGMRYPLH